MTAQFHRSARVAAIAATGLAVAACEGPTTSTARPEVPQSAAAAIAAGVPVLPTLEARPASGASFLRLNAVDVTVPARAVGAQAVVAAAVAPGTLVRSLTAPNPDGCGIQTGIAFDGTNLMMTCWYNQRIDLYNPSTGALVKRLNVPSLSGGFYAIGWDGRDQRLYACSSGNRVYRIDTSDPNGDGIVEPGEVAFQFTVQSCIDGFAFDGADRTAWASGDAASTLQHYSLAGTLIGTHSVSGLLGGNGNSGIAAGGGNLYLANNGGSQIYVANKPPTTSTLFATFPRRIEDLECDDLTFRSEGIAVIWQQDAYDRDIQAYAIEPGACPFGGLAATAVVMDVQPNQISLANNPIVNVILISNGIFDATTANLANIRFVVDGNTAAGASVARRGTGAGAPFITSTADYNRDGRLDRLLTFNTSALRAAGLTTSSTNFVVQDLTSASGKFNASDTVIPTIVP